VSRATRLAARFTAPDDSPRSVVRTLGRLGLAGVLLSAGTGHLSSLREEFQAQVPTWVPLDADTVVVGSGVVELVLGGALAVVPRRFRPLVGWVVAAFFVAVFPGNVSQQVTGTDAFGLNSDGARTVRLLFQPMLVVWALWATGAWRAGGDPGRRSGDGASAA
jgi:uncharacterized membrane protein